MTRDEQASWTAYWRLHPAGAACLPNAPPPVEQALRACWLAFFGTLPTPATMIDLACGNGAVMAIAGAAAPHIAVVGVDYATDIAHPGLDIRSGVDCRALPFAADMFDAAISQFGIEYCGDGAVAEMLRVVKPGGRFQIIAHYTDGVLVRHNAARRDALESLVEAGTFAIAADTARGHGSDAASQRVVAVRERWKSQSVVEEIVAAIHQAFAMGPGALATIAELEARARREHARLSAMVNAAMDEAAMQAMLADLHGRGASAAGTLVQSADAAALPLAWRIAGTVAV